MEDFEAVNGFLNQVDVLSSIFILALSAFVHRSGAEAEVSGTHSRRQPRFHASTIEPNHQIKPRS